MESSSSSKYRGESTLAGPRSEFLLPSQGKGGEGDAEPKGNYPLASIRSARSNFWLQTRQIRGITRIHLEREGRGTSRLHDPSNLCHLGGELQKRGERKKPHKKRVVKDISNSQGRCRDRIDPPGE